MRIDANGISIHYSIEGPDDGPVVVLSHSLAANLSMWDWQMPALEDRYRILRTDPRRPHVRERGTDPSRTRCMHTSRVPALTT